MVIQDLKPSRRVEGRWLAVLEDGSILRLGEGEVVDFALYAGKELSEGEAEALTQAARRSGLSEKALNLLDLQTHVPPGAGAEAREAGRRGRRRQPPSLTGWRSWASSTTPPMPPRWSAITPRRDTGSGSCGTNCTAGAIPRELWDEALEGAADPSARH